jgi:hypothetical protein
MLAIGTAAMRGGRVEPEDTLMIEHSFIIRLPLVLIAGAVKELEETWHSFIVSTGTWVFSTLMTDWPPELLVQRRELLMTTLAGKAVPVTCRAGPLTAGEMLQLLIVTLVVKKTGLTVTAPTTVTLLMLMALVDDPEAVKTMVPMMVVGTVVPPRVESDCDGTPPTRLTLSVIARFVSV